MLLLSRSTLLFTLFLIFDTTAVTAWAQKGIDSANVTKTPYQSTMSEDVIKGNAIQVNTSKLHRVQPTENKFELSKVIGATPNFIPVAFLQKGYEVQKAVARVVLPNGQFGTGFLISPSFFITNNHVLNTEELSLKAKFEFNYQTDFNNNPQKIETYNASPGFFYTIDQNDLDYTIVKLEDYPGKKFGFIPLVAPLTASSEDSMPREFSPESVSGKADAMILQIIQHPDHRYKEAVLHDCTFTSVFDGLKYFRYTCDTELDSSGSPVFDKYWRFFALHHGHGNSTWDPATGKEIYIDNEGVSGMEIVSNMEANNITKKITDDMKVLG